jgi:hypothetical protein
MTGRQKRMPARRREALSGERRRRIGEAAWTDPVMGSSGCERAAWRSRGSIPTATDPSVYL